MAPTAALIASLPPVPRLHAPGADRLEERETWPWSEVASTVTTTDRGWLAGLLQLTEVKLSERSHPAYAARRVRETFDHMRCAAEHNSPC